MAGFSNTTDSELFWNQQSEMQPNPYYENADREYQNMQSQQLDFQAFGNIDSQQFFAPSSSESNLYPHIFTPEADYNDLTSPTTNDFDEPPLLEELEIYPDRIFEKTLAVLNPFRAHALADDAEFLTRDTDLGGPICFCLLLAVCLFISGSKAHFGYIYGLSVLSCLTMYCLLTLMTTANSIFTLLSVASVLGYCLLPIVSLSVLGVFFSLNTSVGLILAIVAVVWSSLSASRLFVAISGDSEQRPLIAYPCALVCGVFALLVLF